MTHITQAQLDGWKRAAQHRSQMLMPSDTLALIAALEEAREALKPFADAAFDISESDKDDWAMWEHPASLNVSVAHFRRAAKAGGVM